jgi:hypothetical protein
VKRLVIAGLLAGATLAAHAQNPGVNLPSATPSPAAGPARPAAAVTRRTPPAPGAADQAAVPPPMPPSGGNALLLRGLDKVTGRPTDILAPIGRTVKFATLTITARFCYSTPVSETPETTAFVQIDDHRPEQPARKVFSGWMYASSPGLNPMDHPTYDVWVISCSNNGAPRPVVTAGTAPVKVLSPDSSDKEGVLALPEDAGN